MGAGVGAAAGAGAGVGTGAVAGAAFCATGWPQEVQNLAPSTSWAPQDVQNMVIPFEVGMGEGAGSGGQHRRLLPWRRYWKERKSPMKQSTKLMR